MNADLTEKNMLELSNLFKVCYENKILSSDFADVEQRRRFTIYCWQ